MGLTDEIESYRKAEVSSETAEIELWDHIVFPNVIRSRQISLIHDELSTRYPQRILDYGCGAGWLTRVLNTEDWNVVGVDASPELIRKATEIVVNKSFLVGDCINLPFRNDTFDCVIGSAILHHLDPNKALAECRRVTKPGGSLILMEPNKLNPPAAIGRLITHIQTKDENPFSPKFLYHALSVCHWNIKDFRFLFPYSFALSYTLQKTRLDNLGWLKVICRPVELSERVIEIIPLINRFSYLIFIIAHKE
jgi:SAM-dependent methyltransferase